MNFHGFLWISLDFPWVLHWFSMGFGAMVMLSRVTIQWQLFYARHRITICGPWPNISYFLVAKSGHGPRSAQNCKSITRVSTRNCSFFGGSNFRFLNGLVGGWIVVCWMGGRMEWTNTCQTHSSVRSQPVGGARKFDLPKYGLSKPVGGARKMKLHPALYFIFGPVAKVGPGWARCKG